MFQMGSNICDTLIKYIFHILKIVSAKTQKLWHLIQEIPADKSNWHLKMSMTESNLTSFLLKVLAKTCSEF